MVPIFVLHCLKDQLLREIHSLARGIIPSSTKKYRRTAKNKDLGTQFFLMLSFSSALGYDRKQENGHEFMCKWLCATFFLSRTGYRHPGAPNSGRGKRKAIIFRSLLYDLKQLRFPALIHFRREMRELHSAEIIQIPDDVEVTVKGRVVTVTGSHSCMFPRLTDLLIRYLNALPLLSGPRGTLTRDLRHRFYDMSVIKRNNGSRIFKCEVWFGKGRDVACIKTFCTHVSNMIIGVTKVSPPP